MHPVIARFLDPELARAALDQEASVEAAGPQDRAFIRAAQAHPEQRAALLAGKSGEPEVETALVFLAAHAAALALEQDASLAEAARKARHSLREEGASEDQTESFLASILLEEAFGDENEVDTFDADFVRETLHEVPALAALTREKLDSLLESFLRGAPTLLDSQAREQMGKALLETAWAEGPTPIHSEHVETLLASQVKAGGEEAQEARLRATVELLQMLAKAGLVGPTRLVKLRALLGDDDA